MIRALLSLLQFICETHVFLFSALQLQAEMFTTGVCGVSNQAWELIQKKNSEI